MKLKDGLYVQTMVRGINPGHKRLIRVKDQRVWLLKSLTPETEWHEMCSIHSKGTNLNDYNHKKSPYWKFEPAPKLLVALYDI